MTARLRFLGTGASGGTPGRGRSRRRESSLLVEDGARILIDVTRDFAGQAGSVPAIDAILLTHAHRDASGGLGELRDWSGGRAEDPIPVHASPETIAAVRRRVPRLECCELTPFREGDCRRLGGWTVTGLVVPHARERRYPTFAWRLTRRGKRLTYASDVARLTPELARFAAGSSVLVIDGAMWGRSIFSHLRVDAALPELCEWNVERILVTQIGRTCPPHETFRREVAKLCRRARPAHDGLTVRL